MNALGVCSSPLSLAVGARSDALAPSLERSALLRWNSGSSPERAYVNWNRPYSTRTSGTSVPVATAAALDGQRPQSFDACVGCRQSTAGVGHGLLGAFGRDRLAGRSHPQVASRGPHWAGGIGKTRLAASVANSSTSVRRRRVLRRARRHRRRRNRPRHRRRRRRPPRAERSPLDSLIAWIDERHLLLVLDNCEEVIGPVKQAVETLIDSCPALHVLATCRRPLGVPGELRVPVRPLDRSAAVELAHRPDQGVKPEPRHSSQDESPRPAPPAPRRSPPRSWSWPPHNAAR